MKMTECTRGIRTLRFILPRSWVGYPSRRPKGCGMQSPSGPKVYPKSDAVAAEADFEPVDDATKYCWEQDCAYPFDDAGLSARYFDQG